MTRYGHLVGSLLILAMACAVSGWYVARSIDRANAARTEEAAAALHECRVEVERVERSINAVIGAHVACSPLKPGRGETWSCVVTGVKTQAVVSVFDDVLGPVSK